MRGKVLLSCAQGKVTDSTLDCCTWSISRNRRRRSYKCLHPNVIGQAICFAVSTCASIPTQLITDRILNNQVANCWCTRLSFLAVSHTRSRGCDRGGNENGRAGGYAGETARYLASNVFVLRSEVQKRNYRRPAWTTPGFTLDAWTPQDWTRNQTRTYVYQSYVMLYRLAWLTWIWI